MTRCVALLALAGAAVPALAGTIVSTGTLPLFGSNYQVATWRVAGDAGPASTAFGAEGMTFHNGTLYVSHDHDANRAAGNLVLYTPGAAGDLSSPSRILMGNGPAGLWGPEGITVNTSGTGFGSWPSGSTRITGIETRGTDAFGVFDTGAPGSAMSPTLPALPALDDIAWTSSLDQFVGVEEGPTDTSFLRFYDKFTMTASAARPQVIDGAKGLTVVSAGFASALTGLPVSTAQAFLVVSEFDGFAFYDTTGAAIGPALTLNTYAPITELESVAVDEANFKIYLGDEAGLAIHVVTVPTPAASALLGLAGLVGLRRRR